MWKDTSLNHIYKWDNGSFVCMYACGCVGGKSWGILAIKR